MPARSYWIPAMILWFAATGWLISTKILPTLTTGTPPTYSDLLPKTAVKTPEPVRWSIRWNGKEIGRAKNKITREFDGTGRMTSEVRFEQLPVDELIRDAMGLFGRFAGTITGGEIGPLDLNVVTNLDFNNYGELNRLNTRVDIGTLKDLLNIDGTVNGDTLDLAARLKSGDEDREVFRNKEIKLPPDAMVADTFSPRPKLANLTVGQTWTFQSYQPLMPHNPLTLIEARVIGEEIIEWDGSTIRAKKVVFQKDSGSGISTTRRPVSETWVTDDGTVLRQDLWLASVKVQFVRQPTERTEESENSNRSMSDKRSGQSNQSR